MALDESSQAIKDKIETVWELTVQVCTRVLHHAGVYGFGLMHIPNPDVHQFHRFLTIAVLPILEKLASDPHIEPDDGIMIDNIRQYINHLNGIVAAIDKGDSEVFDSAVAALNKEAMLCH
ncbi:MAG: hypothetical protein KGI08_11370 [Thaumarchaeota archaeon]|nr:hypothetical protein [Nitrososphaerota archaeon]